MSGLEAIPLHRTRGASEESEQHFWVHFKGYEKPERLPQKNLNVHSLFIERAKMSPGTLIPVLDIVAIMYMGDVYDVWLSKNTDSLQRPTWKDIPESQLDLMGQCLEDAKNSPLEKFFLCGSKDQKKNIPYEDKEGWCGSKAILHMFPVIHIPRIQSMFAKNKIHEYTSLKKITTTLNNMPSRFFTFKKIKNESGQRDSLLSWLCNQQSGKMVFSFDFHCMFVDLDDQSIFEPKNETLTHFPSDFDTRKSKLKELGFPCFDCCFELHLHQKKKK